jgi:hypothetical protein
MRRHIASFIVLAVLAGGCTDPGGGNGDGITTEFGLPGAGFNDTGVDGFGNLDLPNLWTHMFGRKQEGDDLNDVHECRDFQRCGVAGVVGSLDLLTGENGNFAVVTTGNFRCVDDDFADDPLCANQEVPVTVSGVETFPALVDTDDGQVWTGAALVFRYALLSARSDPAGSPDSIVIRAGPDGSAATTVLRLTSGSLSDSLPLRASGCGTQVLPDSAGFGIATTYPTCSEWQDASADITDLIGQEARFQFIAGEAGAAIALALDSVRIELTR